MLSVDWCQDMRQPGEGDKHVERELAVICLGPRSLPNVPTDVSSHFPGGGTAAVRVPFRARFFFVQRCHASVFANPGFGDDQSRRAHGLLDSLAVKSPIPERLMP